MPESRDGALEVISDIQKVLQDDVRSLTAQVARLELVRDYVRLWIPEEAQARPVQSLAYIR